MGLIIRRWLLENREGGKRSLKILLSILALATGQSAKSQRQDCL